MWHKEKEIMFSSMCWWCPPFLGWWGVGLVSEAAAAHALMLRGGGMVGGRCYSGISRAGSKPGWLKFRAVGWPAGAETKKRECKILSGCTESLWSPWMVPRRRNRATWKHLHVGSFETHGHVPLMPPTAGKTRDIPNWSCVYRGGGLLLGLTHENASCPPSMSSFE